MVTLLAGELQLLAHDTHPFYSDKQPRNFVHLRRTIWTALYYFPDPISTDKGYVFVYSGLLPPPRQWEIRRRDGCPGTRGPDSRPCVPCYHPRANSQLHIPSKIYASPLGAPAVSGRLAL